MITSTPGEKIDDPDELEPLIFGKIMGSEALSLRC